MIKVSELSLKQLFYCWLLHFKEKFEAAISFSDGDCLTIIATSGSDVAGHKHEKQKSSHSLGYI